MSESEQSISTKDKRPWRKRLGRMLLLYAVVPYFAVTLIFAVIQRKLLYRPTVSDDLRVRTLGLDAELVHDAQIQTPDGETLNGWLLKSTSENKRTTNPLVLYFPGNSLNRHERIEDLREVTSSGYDVLIFDYRGFGDSTGSPSEHNLTADAKLIWEYVKNERDYAEENVVIFGESLGGAVALSLWSGDDPPKPAALILNSTFASMPKTVGWHYPLFPFRFLLLDRWPSKERIARVDVPVIAFHGSEDAMVPISQGRDLAAACPSARFIEFPGGTHNEIPMHRLRKELEETRKKRR
jgi:uncharacterized protein